MIIISTIQFKAVNCKNCYKCIRNCPVKAISFKNDQAQIIEDSCVLCGKCLQVCPQNAKRVEDDVDKVKSLINSSHKVYVSLAPSFASAFGIEDAGSMFAALKKLGFAHMEETAIGAAAVSKEYGKLLCKREMTNIITTACSTIVSIVEKYYPGLIDQLAPVVSPMIAHARMMREMYGSRIKIVFIGPCLAKKEEYKDLQNDDVIDAVITFEELKRWLDEEGILLNDADPYEYKGIKDFTARFYPSPGGILKTLSADMKRNYKCISIDGIERCMEVLDSINKGEIKDYFIEMNSCTGGCLGGPCTIPCSGGLIGSRERLIHYVKRNSKNFTPGIMEDIKINLSKKFINKSKAYSIPDEDTIRKIMYKIGKFSKDQELNCGACGYFSCREKAIAVYNNKAEIYMCLPYMRERAESISNIITNSTPNAIFALNHDLCIQEVNLSAKKMFRLEKEDFLGKNIFEVIDCTDLDIVKETRQDILNKKYYYGKFDITVEQSIIYVRDQQMIILIMKDITEDEKKKQHMQKVRCETVEIAQRVIEKQMTVAQEIASLLGETTAETKVALTKLKNSIISEIGEQK